MIRRSRAKLTNDDQYFTAKSGTTVNISELLRIFAAVEARLSRGCPRRKSTN
jgi:hypothetical protein